MNDFEIFLALNVKMPISYLGYRLRFISRELRGKRRDQQPTTLPCRSWRNLVLNAPIRLLEADKSQGNVSLSEVIMLAKLVTEAKVGEEIIEIGTFDGRTTLNMAVNSHASCPIFTLDLPQGDDTAFDVEEGEKSFIDKPKPGMRFVQSDEPSTQRITQMLGDSAIFDWSEHEDKAGFMFVDGSHAYDYAKKDTETAFRLIRPGGFIVWHDYGVWEGVTKALEEIEAEQKLGLQHIRGTSLVVYRHPEAA
ncbi:MAG: class I SAM-dependent methyltransferase [Mariprofundaceae bacterium]|nr:class I SAM-dependent methyltransferase [Mariprofundaceae bacterium]